MTGPAGVVTGGHAVNPNSSVGVNAAAGSDAFTGLEVGTIVLALTMAAGCARGLSRRLAEYR